MKIAHRQGDEGGAEMKFGVVLKDGRNFVYFFPPGTDSVNPNTPHFVIVSGVGYGDLTVQVDHLNNIVEKFVCPDFADREELKQLRAENRDLRRAVVEPKELEQLRAGCAELERLKKERREASRLRARLTELESQDDG